MTNPTPTPGSTSSPTDRSMSLSNRPIYAAVGQRIRTQREAAGLTQTQLAAALGTTAQTIVRWEDGRGRPSVEDLYWIANVLGVGWAELLPPIG